MSLPRELVHEYALIAIAVLCVIVATVIVAYS